MGIQPAGHHAPQIACRQSIGEGDHDTPSPRLAGMAFQSPGFQVLYVCAKGYVNLRGTAFSARHAPAWPWHHPGMLRCPHTSLAFQASKDLEESAQKAIDAQEEGMYDKTLVKKRISLSDIKSDIRRVQPL